MIASKQRIEYIDIMKALGIILVVLNHGRWLPDFHDNLLMRIYTTPQMPMFFFISGLFLPYRKTAGNPLYIVKHILRHIALPWIVFASIGFFLLVVVCNYRNDYWPQTLIFASNIPLWFLRALAVAMFIEIWPAVFCRTRSRRIIMLIMFGILSLAAFPLSDYIHHVSWTKWLVYNTLCVAEVCAMMVYMWAGHMLVCELDASRLTLSRRKAAIVFAASSVVMLMLDAGPIHYRFVEYEGSPLAIWLTSWLGIVAFWSLACLLRGCKPLALIGSCTLIILCVHYLPLQMADSLWQIPRYKVCWLSLLVSAIAVAVQLKIRSRRNSNSG